MSYLTAVKPCAWCERPLSRAYRIVFFWRRQDGPWCRDCWLYLGLPYAGPPCQRGANAAATQEHRRQREAAKAVSDGE